MFKQTKPMTISFWRPLIINILWKIYRLKTIKSKHILCIMTKHDYIMCHKSKAILNQLQYFCKIFTSLNFLCRFFSSLSFLICSNLSFLRSSSAFLSAIFRQFTGKLNQYYDDEPTSKISFLPEMEMKIAYLTSRIKADKINPV